MTGITRPPHSAEFRREALSLLRSGARTPKALAAEPGCTEQTLRNWLRQDQADRGERTAVLTSDERWRLRDLERENRVLLSERIGRIHDSTLGIYGAPCIHAELRIVCGIYVGRKRVARLMHPMGIFGAHRRGRVRTTVRDPIHESAPDLVERRFVADRPDRLWVCDIKYVQTGQGFLFLAAVQDVFSRRIVGWAMRADMTTTLILDALGMAVARRYCTPGLVAHSDHGSQYTSLAYGAYAKRSGIALSMGAMGIRGTTRSPRRSLATREAARMRLFWYIECFYNTHRRHSALGYLSPADYEKEHLQEAIPA